MYLLPPFCRSVFVINPTLTYSLPQSVESCIITLLIPWVMFFLHKWNSYSSFLRPKVIKIWLLYPWYMQLLKLVLLLNGKLIMLHLLPETFQKFPRRSFTSLQCIRIWLQLGSLIYSNGILFRNFIFMWEMLLSTQLKKKHSRILNLSKMYNSLVSILHVFLHLNDRTSISNAVYQFCFFRIHHAKNVTTKQVKSWQIEFS